MSVSQFFVAVDGNPDSVHCLLCIEKNKGRAPKPLSATRQWNLKKHLANSHRETYDKHFNEKLKKQLKKKRLKMMQKFCEIVTINGRPFAYLLDSGFLGMIQDDMENLDYHGKGITMDTNFRELKTYIEQLADKLQLRIRQSLKDRFISLMVDAASKNNISILGISAQYLADGKMNQLVLGMSYMSKAHTALYMKNKLKSCLEDYDIPTDRVISITTDNASSMISMTKRFDDDAHDAYPVNYDDFEDIDLGLPRLNTDDPLSAGQMEQIMQSIINIEEIRGALEDENHG